MWNLWSNNVIKEVSSTRVVKCHWGDLPTILACFWGWNTILRSPSYYPSSFWSPQGMGDCYGWWVIVKPNLPCYLPMTIIPTTRLWERLRSNVILHHWLSKWFKLTKLCKVMMLGSVEDEHIFSNLAFIKTKLWNCLTMHLDLVVQMYV